MKRTELKRKTAIKAKAPMKRATPKKARSSRSDTPSTRRSPMPHESYLALSMTPIRSDKIRRAAEGERCTLEILDVCNGRTDTTVLAHLPDDGGIMGGKQDDISACFSCYACHDVIDGRRPWPDDVEKGFRDWYLRRAQTRTLRRLIELGVITIQGVSS